MIERYRYDGDVTIGGHKAIDVNVDLQIETRWDNPDGPEWTDGVASKGEFYFDTFQIQSCDNHPIKRNVLAVMRLKDGEDTTRFNVLIGDKTGEVVVVEKKIRRYYWEFFKIGFPSIDKIGLSPKHKKHMNRLYVSTDFRGIWPTGVSSVVVARNEQEARKLMESALTNAGIIQPEAKDFSLQEIDLVKPQALILNKGELF